MPAIKACNNKRKTGNEVAKHQSFNWDMNIAHLQSIKRPKPDHPVPTGQLGKPISLISG
jgi:hypothetical protein